MWLWILSALFIVLTWTGWWFLGGPLFGISYWYPLVITGVVLLIAVGIVVFRRIRAARAARALEKAIANQAQEQALAAKPERAAEIRELHRQMQQGINALKASKLGGGKRGADALSVLPWYVIVGPPGAGKTTALRHSGLVFPYLDPNGGGVQGVGGTRNCDWWFTNEGILLDTAGRYTTESDDHDEWIAFLEQLAKTRPTKPINGVIVAVSVSELLDATDDQIQDTASRIRARIDEMQTTLKETLPVYVLFTKVDLVAGFAEFFGDQKKSERSQAWGATLRLDADRKQPGKLFGAEFDALVERLHGRSLRRMVLERNRDTKERVYQFPLEFAAIKRNLAEFINLAFKTDGPGPMQPVLRGFYFTSGIQEGKPLDRVVGAMGRAFGLRAAGPAEPTEKAESKSFFLRDVFLNVIFPDQDIAARTEAEIRRLFLQRAAAAAVVALFTLLFLVPSVIRFVNNRRLVADTRADSDAAKAIDWAGGLAGAKIEKLDRLLDRVKLLHENFRKGPPMRLGFPMYQGDKLYRPIREQYLATLRTGFLLPVKSVLSERLQRTTGAKYLDEYNTLKAYLLLGDKVHLQDNAEWQKGRLVQSWAEILRHTDTDLSEQDIKLKILPHVSFYVDLLKDIELAKDDQVPPEDLDRGLVERTRDILTRVGPAQRYYDQFVTVLEDQKLDESGAATPENLKFPPITLQSMFADRPEVLNRVRSSQHQRQNKWMEVRGPYTFRGHEQVLASLGEGYKVLEREEWVVPLTAEEQKGGDRISLALDRVRQDYDDQYVREWVNFFRDVDVAIPATNREAINEYKALATPDWPYQRLLRSLADNTQFEEVRKRNEAESALLADGGVVDQVTQRIIRQAENRSRMRLGSMINSGGKPQRVDPVPEKFRSMVRFAVPPTQPKPKEGEASPAPQPVELESYVSRLQDLAGEMGNIEDGPVTADTKKATEKFEDAVKATQSTLLKMDDTGQDLLTPLLMNPLKDAHKAVVRHAGGSASGLWEVQVWPAYRDKIKDRYPFNLAATRDASFQDAVAFFKPKDGILWGFYDQLLRPFHNKVGHDFVPNPHLEERPRPAKPFTPFRPLMYPCLKRADEITDALFPEGAGDKPKVEFQVNLKNVSPIVSDVLLEVDGQKRLYRNEKEFWNPMTWPGPKPTGARLQVRGASGLDEELVREGPWGMFRLFEAGTTTAEKDRDDVFLVTWQLTAPPVTVTLEVRPVRASHPFAPSFFRATNCPPSIGDAFGKGKG